MDVSKNRGTPIWMVKVMENPFFKWMIWGENPLFSETSMYRIWSTYILPQIFQAKNLYVNYSSPHGAVGAIHWGPRLGLLDGRVSPPSQLVAFQAAGLLTYLYTYIPHWKLTFGNGKAPFLVGDTSSNGWVSQCHLGFQGCISCKFDKMDS